MSTRAGIRPTCLVANNMFGLVSEWGSYLNMHATLLKGNYNMGRGMLFFVLGRSRAGAGPEPGRSRTGAGAGPEPGRRAGVTAGGRAGAGGERNGVSAKAGPEPGRSRARVRAGRKREPGPEPGQSGAGPEPRRSRPESERGGSGSRSVRVGPEPGRSRAGAGPESERGGSEAGPEPGQSGAPERASVRWRNLLRCVATVYAPKFRAGRSGSWSRSRAAWPEWFRVGRVGAGWSCSLDCAEREPETWSQPARAPELAKLQFLSILCMFQALSFKKHTHTNT